MAYTLIPVTRTYLDGVTPRTGTVRLQLVGPLYNEGEIADRQPQVATLDVAGSISLTVRATNDPGTLPVGGGAYEVTETLSGLATEVYYIHVPFDGGPVDLAVAPRLLPEDVNAPAVLFQPVNERGLPGGYPVLDDGGRVPHDQLPADLGGGTGSGVELSGQATDIMPLGTRAPGASGKAADASHVHEMPALNQLKQPTATVNLGGQRAVNAGAGIDPGDLATVGQLGQSLMGWVNVKDPVYGAKGDGATDDTAAIQAALDACEAGGIVYLPQGVYCTSAPLVIPPAITVRGSHANLMAGLNVMDPACYLQPLAGFTGASMLVLKDQLSGGYTELPAEHRIENLMLDGSTLDGTVPIDALYAEGNIQNVTMRQVTIRRMSNNGIVTGGVDNVFPYSWRLYSVMIDNCRANGLLLTRMTDLTLDDVQVIGCWGHGMVLNNIANSQLIGCRAEWNGNHGIHITGAWGNGTGSGGMLMSACSTDRNGYDGVRIDATGNAPIIISNLSTRRDGRNGGGGGGGYAGIHLIGATVPVVLDGITCYPGVDDDGTGTSSPDYGINASGSTSVQIGAAYLHGALKGLQDDGTNVSLHLSAGVTTASGTTAAPARNVHPQPVDWRNVKAFGAKGDGFSDDTAALQAAIDNAAAARTMVFIPAGTYIVSAPLVLPAGEGYGIIGSGWGSSVKLKAASDCYVFQMTGDDTRVIFRDLEIDGNCLEQGLTGASGGIDGSGAVACHIENVHFVACRDNGLYLGGMTNLAFGHNNRVWGCLFDESMASTGPGRGIHMNSSDENQIIGCDFEFLGGSGGTTFGTAVCILDQAGTQFIEACNFVGGAVNNCKGIRLQDCSSTKINACNFDGTAGDSIFIAATGNSVTGCTIFSPGEVGTLTGEVSGIHLEFGTKNNLIVGNSLASSTTDGKTRSLIREEATGDAGPNLITNNVLITKGTLAVAVTEFGGAGSITTPNLGAA